MLTTRTKLIILVFILTLSSIASSQMDWQANFFVKPYPSPYVSDWEYDRSTASLTLYNNSGAEENIIIRVRVNRQSGQFIGEVNSNILSIPPSPPPTILNSDDIFDWDTAEYDESIKNIIIRTGRLPEGNFEACARVEKTNGEVLIEEVCAFFSIIHPSPPMLIIPVDQDTIQSLYQMFQWTPVILPPDFQVSYMIKIAEVFPGQQPERALNSNQPHHEEYEIVSNSYQYPVDGLPFEPAKQYAWQVQALDQYGEPCAANNGKSEIWTFFAPDTTSDEPHGPGKRAISGRIFEIQSEQGIADVRMVYHKLEREFIGDSLAYIKLPDSVTVSTNDAGEFAFEDVPDSSYFSITASKAGYLPEEYISYDYQMYYNVRNIDMRMAADYADLSGKLLQIHTRAPIGNTIVELWQKPNPGDSASSPSNVGRGNTEPHLIISARTDTSGYFTFDRIPGGDGYFLKVDHSKYEEFTSEDFSVTGGLGVNIGEFFLTPLFGSIEGIVKDFETGQIISNAFVYIYPDSGITYGRDQSLPDDMTRPESLPIAGPDTTDFSGQFRFDTVLLNELDQPADRHVVWVEADTYKPSIMMARITEIELNKSLEINLVPQPGMLRGTVTSSVDGGPIGDVRVELKSFSSSGIGRGQVGVTRYVTYSNPDGSYSITDIEASTYIAAVFSKRNLSDFVARGPFEITNGRVITIDAVMDVPVGVVKGTVVNEDGNPLYGVSIMSSNAPSVDGYTEADGSFLLTNVPSGDIILDFSLPGHNDISDTITVVSSDTAEVEITMQGYHGNITIVVQDSTTGDPIADATVEISGMAEQSTDQTGQTVFARIPVGPKQINITPPENDQTDYRSRTVNIDIVDGPNNPITIKLLPAGRISGRVVMTSSNSPIDGAYISIEGISGIIDSTGSSGEFTLRNVPANENLTLVASKVGFTTARVAGITIQPGEHRDDIVFELQESEIDSVFGFAVELDSLISLPGGLKRAVGAIVNVQSNPALSLRDLNIRLYFDSLIVDSQNRPVGNSFPINLSEIPVKVFDKLNAVLSDTSGGLLNIEWVDSLGMGQIKSDLVMGNAIPNWIPGSEWAMEKIGRISAPALWPDGVYHGPEGMSFGLNITGQNVSFKFWGFNLSVDYEHTTIDEDGFHYYGSIQFPNLPREIIIEDLNIRARDGGGVEFVGVGVKTDPPIEIDLNYITVVDSSATWNQSGFRADGAILANTLNREFGFRELRISPEGDFLSLIFNADARSGTISVLSADFTISEIGFGTEEDTHIRYFMFSGALAIPQLDQPIEFQNLRWTEEGDFSGRIQFNQEKTLASVVTLQLQAIEFNEDDNGKFIFIEGGVAFNIPNLHVQAGNIRYYEDGSFNIERIELSFRAGAVQVAVAAEWTGNMFSGSGSLIVQPAFTSAAEFRYGGSDDWWIKVTANTRIPIGTVMIVNVTGELGYQEGTWIFGFGGGFTAGNMEKALRMDLYVRVLATPEGPIINGSADLVAMSGMTIGTASICLDFVQDRFTGNIMFTFNKAGIELSAQIDLDVKSGEYWYVGGQATINFFSMYDLNPRLALANNYNGWMHTLPVSFHPDNQTINGFHSDLTFHTGASGCCWGLSVDAWAFMMVNWQGDFAGGVKLHANAYVDVWIVGGSVSADMEAALQYVNNCFNLHAHAGVRLKVWIGCCNSGSGCWNVCWKWIFPCGGTACFGVDINADYACNRGWDFDVDW